MFKWFRNCKTAEEGKKLYHDLVKKFHTDNGGDLETIKAINAEFSIWWKSHKDIHTDKNGETKKSQKETTETAEQFMDIINALFNIGVKLTIEIRGSWLWITGDTYPVREQLKGLGCRWSTGQHSWYWTVEEFTKARYKRKSKEEQRNLYGYSFVSGGNERMSIGQGE